MFKKALVFASLGVFALACSSTITNPAVDNEAGPGKDGGLKETTPGTDGSSNTCVPGDVSSLTPTWKPPSGFNQGKCTATQVSAFVDCLSNMPDAATCKTFLTAAENTACKTCAITSATAAKYGPLIEGTVTIEVNVAGCIAQAQGDAATGAMCGAKVIASSQCEQLACEANCPVPTGDDGTAFAALLACQTKSDGTVCKTYATAAACADAATADGGPAAVCAAAGTTFSDNAKAMVSLFCGGAVSDGGGG